MTFRLGLTGSIGMGKSTTAQMFADAGCALWDADAAVHRLYAQDGAAVGPLLKAMPDVVIDGAVSRDALKARIDANPTTLTDLEHIVHPLVAADRSEFAASSSSEITVFDIPLLFETGSDAWMHAVAVATTDANTQRTRVLARGGMTPDRFEMILQKQLPDAEKRARADYVILTDTLDHAREQVHHILSQIRESLPNA